MSFEQREDGNYTKEELMKCQAFIVFFHAEVENYLEKVARRIMLEARKRWEDHGTLDRVIATLLAFRRKEITQPPDDPKNTGNKSDLATIINDCIRLQEKAISENHGIKRRNVSELLCPLGVLPDDLEEVMLIQLTNTGSKRGEFVHKQNSVSLSKIRDPFADEITDVDNLIKELSKLDQMLETLHLLSTP